MLRRFLATPLLMLGFLLLRAGIGVAGMTEEEELDEFFGLESPPPRE